MKCIICGREPHPDDVIELEGITYCGPCHRAVPNDDEPEPQSNVEYYRWEKGKP